MAKWAGPEPVNQPALAHTQARKDTCMHEHTGCVQNCRHVRTHMDTIYYVQPNTCPYLTEAPVRTSYHKANLQSVNVSVVSEDRRKLSNYLSSFLVQERRFLNQCLILMDLKKVICNKCI